MKLISYDGKNGELRLKPQTLEDLWTLSRVVSPGDQVEGQSERRFKSESQRASSGEKKHVKVRLKVETAEFAKSANKLRMMGTILSGEPEEFVQLGNHHTLDVETGEPFTLYKKLSAYDKHLLNEALQRTSKLKAVIVVLDEQNALACSLDAMGLHDLFELRNSASKRDPDSFDSLNKKFFSELIESIKRSGAGHVIIAGPGFQRESLKKVIDEKEPELAAKAGYEHASSAEKTAIHELLKRGLVEKLLGKQKLSLEYKLLEELKASLGRGDGMAVYGKDALQAVQLKAARTVMVEDEFLRKNPPIGELLEEAEKGGAEVVIFDSSDDAGREFADFRMAALLRYRIK